jgi:hypothetical protein
MSVLAESGRGYTTDEMRAQVLNVATGAEHPSSSVATWLTRELTG